MSILKVEVGAPVTMTVKTIREVDGKFGAQFAFDDEQGNTLFVGADTAQRQLDRLNMGRDGAIGQALLFEKVQKNGKTFLNINPAKQGNGKSASGGGSAQARSGASGTAAGTERVSRPLGPLYADCLSLAKEIVGNTLGQKGTTDNVLNAAACLFIEANKSGTALRAPAGAKKPVPSDDFEEVPDELYDDSSESLPF